LKAGERIGSWLNRLQHEIGLLRTIVRNLERTPIPVDPRAVAFWRAQGIEVPPGDAGSKTTIRPAGHNAFNQLSECLMAHSEAMERGTNFPNFQTELFSQLEAFVGRDPEAIARTDAQRLVDHFTEWFKSHASPRKVFVPCVLTPGPRRGLRSARSPSSTSTQSPRASSIPPAPRRMSWPSTVSTRCLK
jgi:hypothetical protein